jgi:hypothetical protein
MGLATGSHRPRLTYSNVVATAALFLALGGTSYALTQLPRNSVGTAQLRNRAVTPAKLAVAALARGPVGPVGPQGPAGADGALGATGPPGATGPSNVYLTTKGQVPLPATGGANLNVASLVDLPAGEYWVVATASASYQDPGASGSDYFRCGLLLDGQGIGGGSVVRIGTDAGGALASGLTAQAAVTLSATDTINLQCDHDMNLPQGNPRMESVELAAIQVGNVTTQ